MRKLEHFSGVFVGIALIIVGIIFGALNGDLHIGLPLIIAGGITGLLGLVFHPIEKRRIERRNLMNEMLDEYEKRKPR